jgi:fructose-1,6-bisphosphatase/inositol monophosphatase family enzyme
MAAELLPLAREAASAAGYVLLTERPLVRAQGASAAKPAPSDPVTRTDIAAQRVITDLIAKVRPGDAILGEEGLDRPGDTGWRWIIDPLDGKINYLYGREDWAVSVALQDPAGDTVVGVILAPALGRTYTAALGRGAWCDGRRLIVRDCAALAEAVVGTGFAFDSGTRAAQAALLARVMPEVADIRRVGSAALDLAGVASGRLDAFYENDLALSDWAAGALIATEAGAVVTELPGPAGRGGVLAAGPEIAGPLAKLLSPAGNE